MSNPECVVGLAELICVSDSHDFCSRYRTSCVSARKKAITQKWSTLVHAGLVAVHNLFSNHSGEMAMKVLL